MGGDNSDQWYKQESDEKWEVGSRVVVVLEGRRGGVKEAKNLSHSIVGNGTRGRELKWKKATRAKFQLASRPAVLDMIALDL